jgi:hypothetical protein
LDALYLPLEHLHLPPKDLNLRLELGLLLPADGCDVEQQRISETKHSGGHREDCTNPVKGVRPTLKSTAF